MSPTRRGRGPRPESATALRRERESEIIGWVLMAVRWAFPRFRYDQIMRLGWKMMLPVSLTNVALTAAVFLWAGRDGVAWMGIIQWIAFLFFIGFSARAQPSAEPGSHSSTVVEH